MSNFVTSRPLHSPIGGVTQEEGWDVKYGKQTRSSQRLSTRFRRSALLQDVGLARVQLDMKIVRPPVLSLVCRVKQIFPAAHRLFCYFFREARAVVNLMYFLGSIVNVMRSE
ncbi:hypothetical protein GOODEAATRI_027639 [Goodea atripinnis]|uniref:Uncharacterized protein n=1 Tax=Goodea atripinnis TaxID=208336 RepID=A0ABV0NYC8_9TELE